MAQFENDFNLEDLKSALANSNGIVLRDDIEKNVYPLATEVNNHDEVHVGRIRRDYSVKYGINMWV